MSGVTYGPPVMLDGPLPVAPSRSLTSVHGVLQDTPIDEHWVSGVHLWGYPAEVPEAWNPCSAGTYKTKSDTSSLPTPYFDAFVGYLPVTCSSFSLANDPEGFAERAEIALNANISYIAEYALSQGVPFSANPFLCDANVTFPAGVSAVSPATGLAYLEDAIGSTGKDGMIHATPAVASRWFNPWRDTYLARRAETPERGSIITSIGTHVAVGGGYLGAVPYGESDPGLGKAWAFATGQVHVRLEAETKLNIKEVLDRKQNLVTFRAERYVLVTWDTALQAAVLIDWAS